MRSRIASSLVAMALCKYFSAATRNSAIGAASAASNTSASRSEGRSEGQVVQVRIVLPFNTRPTRIQPIAPSQPDTDTVTPQMIPKLARIMSLKRLLSFLGPGIRTALVGIIGSWWTVTTLFTE